MGQFNVGDRIRAADNGRTSPRFANKEGTIIGGPTTHMGSKRAWEVRYDNGVGNQSGVITPEEDMELICFKVGDRVKMKDIPDVPGDFRGEEGTIESEETRPPLSGPPKKRWNVNFDNVSNLPVSQNPVVVPEAHMDVVVGFRVGVRIKMKDRSRITPHYRNQEGVIVGKVSGSGNWRVDFDDPAIGPGRHIGERNMIVIGGSGGSVEMIKHTKEEPITDDMLDYDEDECIESGDRVILKHGTFKDFNRGTIFKVSSTDFDDHEECVRFEDVSGWISRDKFKDCFYLVTEYEVEVSQGPKNNDGRDICVFCGGPTRDFGAVAGMMPIGKVCTVCNR